MFFFPKEAWCHVLKVFCYVLIDVCIVFLRELTDLTILYYCSRVQFICGVWVSERESVCAFMFVCVGVCVWVYRASVILWVCMFLCMYVCMCVGVRVHVCMRTWAWDREHVAPLTRPEFMFLSLSKQSSTAVADILIDRLIDSCTAQTHFHY